MRKMMIEIKFYYSGREEPDLEEKYKIRQPKWIQKARAWHKKNNPPLLEEDKVG